MRRITLSVVLLLAVLGSAAGAEPRDPRRTFVFVAGLLEWQHTDDFESFPKPGRRDAELVKLFRAQGVPAGQIAYLQDRAATARAIRTRLIALLSLTRPGDTLFVYYCGHGYVTDAGVASFAAYDASADRPSLPMAEIPALVQRHFRGAQAILLADACYSGRMAQAAARLRGGPPMLVLASADARQTSTERWTFTEAILAGLAGAAWTDQDHDGQVRASELAAFVTSEMMWAEDQIAGTWTAPGFPARSEIARAAAPQATPVGDRVGVFDEGQTWPARVLGVRGSRLRVHFVGFPDSEDRWITRSALRPLERPHFAVGTRVEVEDAGEWYPARVLQVKGSAHLVHYDDYGSEEDAWVSSDSIRAAQRSRPAGAGAVRVGVSQPGASRWSTRE